MLLVLLKIFTLYVLFLAEIAGSSVAGQGLSILTLQKEQLSTTHTPCTLYISGSKMFDCFTILF